MIDIIYHSENAFIYNADDWEKIRKEYRITGELFGRTLRKTAVLPVQLMHEEALLLIEKEFGRLVKYKEKVFTKEEQHALNVKQFEAYKELRRQQLNQYIDKVVAGKRKKGDMRSVSEIIQGELDKIVMNEKNMVRPTKMHNFDLESAELVDKELLMKQTTRIKYETYKNLWEKKLFITSGWNFGGDFLVYPGDPILYHAHYVVRCLNESESLYPSEFVVLGRVATSVKKKGVLSYLLDDKVNYLTIKWIGK